MPSGLTCSVALATFNGTQYLREQLDSLAAQSRLPMELVVCDDGSSDGTLDLVETWARTAPFPVRTFRNKTRLGFADNFLHAASFCSADLIAFCDQDDVWLPGKLGRCIRRFESDDEVMLVSHNAWVTDNALAKQRLLHSSPRLLHYRHRQLRLLDHYFFGFELVFRAKLIQNLPWLPRADDYILDDAMSHDHWVPFLAGALGSVVLDPSPLALYRQHGRNAMGANWTGDTPEFVTRTEGATVFERLLSLQQRMADWAEFLVKLSESAGQESDRRKLAAAGERYAAISRRYSARSELYRCDQGPARRAEALASLILTGGYRSKRSGGLGIRPALRDLLTVGLGSRSAYAH